MLAQNVFANRWKAVLTNQPKNFGSIFEKRNKKPSTSDFFQNVFFWHIESSFDNTSAKVLGQISSIGLLILFYTSHFKISRVVLSICHQTCFDKCYSQRMACGQLRLMSESTITGTVCFFFNFFKKKCCSIAEADNVYLRRTFYMKNYGFSCRDLTSCKCQKSYQFLQISISDSTLYKTTSLIFRILDSIGDSLLESDYPIENS